MHVTDITLLIII